MGDKTHENVFPSNQQNSEIVLELRVRRRKFDDNHEDEIRQYLESIGASKIDIFILCDICDERLKDRVHNVRRLCDSCMHYYDFCVTHKPPDLCPLCKAKQ